MAFCTSCGSNVNGAFCPQCGKPVGAPQAAAPPPPPPPPQGFAPQPVQPQYPPPQGFGPQPVMAMPPAQRRGMSPVVMVLLILVGLFLLCVVGVMGFGLWVAHTVAKNPGLAIAKLMTAANPNLQIVNTDNGAGTITVRDKDSGKVSTLTFDQARNGRFTISANDEHGGKASMQFGGAANDLPAWVPKYPGAANTGLFSATGTDGNDKGAGGSFTFTTSDNYHKVLDFYKDKAAELGMKVNMNTDTAVGGMIVAAEEADKRSLMVTANGDGGKTEASVTYGAKQ